MSAFTALTSLYPSDVTKGTEFEWNRFYNITIVKCECCDFITFAGCRKSRSRNSESNTSATPQSSKPKCRKDRLWTLRLQCSGDSIHCFCPAGSMSTSCKCTRNTQDIIHTGCQNCEQKNIPLSLIHLKATKEELDYAVSSFPRSTGKINHTLIACKDCGVMGFPGIQGKLTESNGEFDFWMEGDEEYMSRSACSWGLDHTPDCTCKDTQDLSNYVTFRTLLSLDELKFARSGLRNSLTCRDAHLIVPKCVDLLQTKLALANNEALIALQKSSSEEEILVAISELSDLLDENKMYFPSQKDSFPLMVLSDVKSFLEVAKAVKSKMGPNVWTRTVAKSFGKLLRSAKSARSRRMSRTSKVVVTYKSMSDMGTNSASEDRRHRVTSM